MAHDVSFDIPRCELGKADIHITVKSDGEILGKLEVSKGAAVWYPKDCTYGHKATWKQFADSMEKFPRVEKRKNP